MKANQLEVWIDNAILSPEPIKVGDFHQDHGTLRFIYDRKWLDNPKRFAIDPDLSLDGHVFFPDPTLGNFRILLDSSPNRW